MVDGSARRSAALEWAGAARTRRLGVRQDLSRGLVTLPEVLAEASVDPLLAAVRLQWVLESLPGARKTDTRRALGAHRLDGDLAIGRLDDAERATVLALFSPAGSAS